MLLNLCLVIAAALSTFGVYSVNYGLRYWWILPVFVGFYVLWIVLYLLVLFITSLFMSTKEPIKKPKEICRFFIVETMEYVMQMLRIKIGFLPLKAWMMNKYRRPGMAT